MVHGVTSGTINDWVVRVVFSIVDEDGPDVDEHEESNVCKLLEGEEERENVVRRRLCESVEWVESMRCEWRRNNPFVMRLVQGLVHQRMMQAAVDPVDAEVGEEDEEWELEHVVPRKRRFR